VTRRSWKPTLPKLEWQSDAKVPGGRAQSGFRLVREGSHVSMVRECPDGTDTPLTMPNHRTIKGSTLRTILTQAGLSRDDFLKAYEAE
jgi:predicted RNA binding protein YcfA (HicA-like mRNA interferase family)